MKISLLLPTRNRPDNLRRFVESARSLASDPDNIEIVAYIDRDDVSYDGVLPALDIKVVRGERIVLSQMWNECYKVATGEIFGHMGDDIIFRTVGWDDVVRRYINYYSDHIAFVYGRDGFSPDTFGTHGFLHRNWVDAVGYFVPPYFSSDYNDTWLNDVSTMVGRHLFAVELYTEHMHFINGKGPKDQTHIERLARHAADRVENVYKEKEKERIADADKLRNVMILSEVPKPQPLLSMLIPSVVPRTLHLNRHLYFLSRQIERDNLGGKVEIVVAYDDFETPLGEKRNLLLNEARGKYLVYCDDDDSIANDYFRTIVDTLEANPDADYVGYRISLLQNGYWGRDTYHSLRYDHCYGDDRGYYRNISHINPLRSDIAKRFVFPNLIAGEDVDWDTQVYQSGFVKKEVYIDRCLYIYNSNQGGTPSNAKLSMGNRYQQNCVWEPVDIDLKNIRLVGKYREIDWYSDKYRKNHVSGS